MVIRAIFSPKWANRIFAELSYTDRMFSGFINGKILDSLLIGVLNFVGMLLLQLPYALLVSVLVGVTNLIPFFGPYIGMIPSAFLILLVNPWQCVLFLVFNILLQQFDGNVLGPRILGNVTGLSSFWVLFSILLFGGLFGFVGMIVGVPVCLRWSTILCGSWCVRGSLTGRGRRKSVRQRPLTFFFLATALISVFPVLYRTVGNPQLSLWGGRRGHAGRYGVKPELSGSGYRI